MAPLIDNVKATRTDQVLTTMTVKKV